MLSLTVQEFLFTGVLPASVMIFFLTLTLCRKPFKKQHNNVKIEERLSNFHPQPLIEFEVPNSDLEILQPNEDVPGVLNLAKVNYLNLLNNVDIRNSAEDSIRFYGVGSCGPRGFYGTIDIHLDLEDRLAKFMEMEEAVLYSYGFSTIASAIGAYCKKSDVIFCDEKVNYSIKQGMVAARSKVIYFNHNDMEDFERKLIIESQNTSEIKKKPVGKFLIVEGIYEATGTICKLPALMKLREKYQMRIFIDESYSFGVLGKYGRGVTDYFNIDRANIDMIMSSLEGSVGSIGGFCVGASAIIEHQRLSGLGYCFSASLPPFLTQAAICALDMFEKEPSIFGQLENVCVTVHGQLCAIPEIRVISDTTSPLKVFTMKDGNQRTLDSIHAYCTNERIYMINLDEKIRFHVNITMSTSDIKRIVESLKNAIKS